MRVRFKYFRGTYTSWEELFGDAAAFASRIGPDRLINISQSSAGSTTLAEGVVTVWYWDDSNDTESGG
jgi:hypothetical protein